HAEEFGGDPDTLIVTGGSAGGHLAALVALTANDPEFQPGFESVDTRVDGCVAFYGVYDFVDEGRNWPHGGCRDLLEKHVMKTSLDKDRAGWGRASPIYRIPPHAPPLLLIHRDPHTLGTRSHAPRFPPPPRPPP